MNYIIAIVLFCLPSIFIAQTNYLIEYDKLADKITYFKCDWVKGAQKQTKVESIKLSQNDIISFRIVNVNNFVFDVEILKQEITADKKDSPFKTLLSAFTGIGGPALNLLTSLGSNSPKPLSGSRGGSKEIEEYKKLCNETILEMHKVITRIVKSYASIEKNTKVLYSKNKTKAEILFELMQYKEKTDANEIEADYDYLLELNIKLEELLAQDILEFDDPFLDEIEKVEKLYADFENTCLTEDKELKPYDISEIISELEKSSFKVEHRFIAEEGGGYNGKNTSNDFLLIFKERLIGEKDNDDEKALPIDFAKYLSIPIKQPYLPYWSVGADYILPIGGFKEYNVQEIEGDTWQGIPDSLLITSSNAGMMKLGVGTKLTFDLASKNKFISPNVVVGVALTGLNNFDTENWRINFLIGSGLTFRKFPYLSLNAGLAFNQQRILKKEYIMNRTFEQPNGYSDSSVLFKSTFKPGLYFGVNIKI